MEAVSISRGINLGKRWETGIPLLLEQHRRKKHTAFELMKEKRAI